MKKKLLGGIIAFLIMLLLLPVYGKAEETVTKDTERYHAVYVGKDTSGYDFHDTCTEDDFTGLLWNRKNRSAITTSDTGLFETQLTGAALEIYEGLSSAELGPEQNGVSLTHYFTEDETAQGVFDTYRAVYSSALYAYGRDHHDLFLWWSNNHVGITANYNSEQITMDFYYMVSDYYTGDLQTAANERINSLVQACTGYNRETKLRYYHDWIVNNNDYDTPTSEIDENDDPETFYYSHTAVGCLLKGKGVCESYSKLLKIFCLREDIPCLIITSNSHAWNYVKMEDGNWYMVDVTWDDPVGGSGVYDTYFLVSNDPNIDINHTVDQRFAYPTTSQTDYQIEHDYKLTERVEGTCAAEGSETYTCSHCGDSKTYPLPMNPDNHTGEIIIQNEQKATCVSDGYTGDKCCKGCGVILEAGEKIPATAAEHVWNENYTVDKEPTCTEDGFESIHCSVCGTMKEGSSIAIQAKGHSFTKYVSNEDAACEKDGTKTARCDHGCGATDTIVDEGTALRHVNGDPRIENIVEATCMKEGSYDEVSWCRVCGKELYRETKTIDITDHKPSDPVKENVIDATYLNDGSCDSVAYCIFCGKELSREKTVIPKLESKEQTITASRTSYSFTFNSAKAQSQAISVSGAHGILSYISGNSKVYVNDGKIYVSKSTPVGTYTIKITATATGDCEYLASNTITITVKVIKAANTLKVAPVTKKLKATKVKKKAQSFTIKTTQAQGKITYKSSNKKVKVTSAGKVTVKKGTKKGKYKITVIASGNGNYKNGVKNVTIIIK